MIDCEFLEFLALRNAMTHCTTSGPGHDQKTRK